MQKNTYLMTERTIFPDRQPQLNKCLLKTQHISLYTIIAKLQKIDACHFKLIFQDLFWSFFNTNRWNSIFCCRHRVSKWYYMQCIWNFLQDYLCMWNMFDKTLLQHINDARVLCAQRWYMMIITLNLLLQYIWMWRNTLLCVGVTHGS